MQAVVLARHRVHLGPGTAAVAAPMPATPDVEDGRGGWPFVELDNKIRAGMARYGIPGVALYTDVDAHSVHRQMAAEAVSIGAPRAYLDIERVVAAAVETGCDGVHPGYGFLSENAAFATACRDAGLTFIGPTPETIAAMGDKTRARDLAARAGVPLVPGTGKGLSGTAIGALWALGVAAEIVLFALSPRLPALTPRALLIL